MKHLSISFLMILSLLSSAYCQENTNDQNQHKKDKNLPEITFQETEHDFGLIPYGKDATFRFLFKNTGIEPLVLTSVRASCGCTTPTWTKEPIAKKDTSAIKVHYDTKRVGPFQKTVMVYSNSRNSPVTLTIKGEVDKPVPKKRELKNGTDKENSPENPRRVPEK
ncbi:MAG: DUF1573 domain-containing protein [Bacteroidia bacterium]|nr:DUF1573 domain-containing protein [Bacteroidia bacterium]